MEKLPEKFSSARKVMFRDSTARHHLAPLYRAEARRARRKAHCELVKHKSELIQIEMKDASERDIKIAQLANEVWSCMKHRHLATACNITFVPEGNPAVPEVMLCGAAGVGKTALLRALFKSRFPVGRSNVLIRRDGMNFFSVGRVFNICETPGFGGAATSWHTVLQHASLIRNFVRCRPSLKMVYYCMVPGDSSGEGMRHRDIDMLKFLSEEVPQHTIVLTKCDIRLNNKSERKITLGTSTQTEQPGLTYVFEELQTHGIEHPVIATSSFTLGGVDVLRYDMVMNALHNLPTERLTLREARRLSERLLSQAEIATVKPLNLSPTMRDEVQSQWDKELSLDVLEQRPVVPRDQDPQLQLAAATTAATRGSSSSSSEEVTALSIRRQKQQDELLVDGSSAAAPSPQCATLLHADQLEQQRRQENFKAVVKKLSNRQLMQFVHATSPWRDPRKYPSTVIPTKSRRINILRTPDDPSNPYLTQPHFVAGRADMIFRRPNAPNWRVHSKTRTEGKGQYLPTRSVHAIASKRYTIPFFPDIVDVKMQPKPWAFFRSSRNYWQTVGGLGVLLGIRYSNYVTRGVVQAIADRPVAPHLPLAQELRKLEALKYGAPLDTGRAAEPPVSSLMAGGTAASAAPSIEASRSRSRPLTKQ